LFTELTEEERLYGWFQQDSATAHTARMSMQALSDTFRAKNISTGIWHHIHPTLTLTIFSSVVLCRTNFETVNPIWKKKNTHKEIANIPAEQL
jgi:hypothetical protein